MYCYTRCPQLCSRPPLTHTSARDSWTLTGKSGSVSCWVTAPFSWDLVHKVLLCSLRIYFPVLCKFWQLYGGVNGSLLQEGLCHTQVCCIQSPVPVAVHCWPIPPLEMLKHSSVSVSVGCLGPGMHKACLSPLSISGGNGVWFLMWISPSYHLAGTSSLPLDVGYLLTAAPEPTTLLGFLWPWMWDISSQLVQQSLTTTLTLDMGYLFPGARHSSAPCAIN